MYVVCPSIPPISLSPSISPLKVLAAHCLDRPCLLALRRRARPRDLPFTSLSPFISLSSSICDCLGFGLDVPYLAMIVRNATYCTVLSSRTLLFSRVVSICSQLRHGLCLAVSYLNVSVVALQIKRIPFATVLLLTFVCRELLGPSALDFFLFPPSHPRTFPHKLAGTLHLHFIAPFSRTKRQEFIS